MEGRNTNRVPQIALIEINYPLVLIRVLPSRHFVGVAIATENWNNCDDPAGGVAGIHRLHQLGYASAARSLRASDVSYASAGVFRYPV